MARHTFTRDGFHWESVTVEEVAADPTDCYMVTVHGDLAVESVVIHDAGNNPWVTIKTKNGGSSSGTPAHWHSFIRRTGEDN